jgi:beta-galactosidase
MAEVYADAGVTALGHPEGLEVVVRRSANAEFTVAINHRDEPLTLAARGVELLTGDPVDGALTVPGGAVAVVRTTDNT